MFGDVDLRSQIAVELLHISGVPEHRDVPVVTGLGVPISPHRHGLMFGHEGEGLIVDAEPKRKIEEEKPYCLIGSPSCPGHCTFQTLNSVKHQWG